MVKKNKYKTTEELEKEIKKEKLTIAVILIIWSLTSIIAINYAFPIDPILSFMGFMLYFGIFLIILMVAYFYKVNYIYLRKTFGQIDEEGEIEVEEEDA